jgi:hypothetical protein
VVILLKRLPVQSRILRSVGYDEITKILELEFQTGVIYHYLKVPQKIYANLMKSDEIYQYFTEKIRPRYQAKRVDVK